MGSEWPGIARIIEVTDVFSVFFIAKIPYDGR